MSDTWSVPGTWPQAGGSSGLTDEEILAVIEEFDGAYPAAVAELAATVVVRREDDGG